MVKKSKINDSLGNYVVAFLANVILAAPFIQFLIWPKDSASSLVTNVPYLLLLKTASFSLTSQFINFRLGIKFSFRQLQLLIFPLLLSYLVYTKIGYIVLIYFVGSLLVDLIVIHRTHIQKLMDVFMGGIARIMLIIGVYIPAFIIASFIHRRYYDTVSSIYNSSTTTYKDVEALIGFIVLFVLYYLLEPFAIPLFDLFFDSKSRVNKFLNKKF